MPAPDYSFRVGGQRVFFLEAKKPAINIEQATGPALQLRRYGWTCKFPLGVVTDFDECATAKKGTADVDNAFLADIEQWRDILA